MQQNDQIADTWARLESWLARKMPRMLKHLNPGATDYELEELEGVLGLKLPADLRLFYSIHNGQNLASETGLFYGMYPRPLADIARYYRHFDDTLSLQIAMADNLEDLLAHTDQAKNRQKQMPNYLWLPFASSQQEFNAGMLCLDLDPHSDGVEGQVIAAGNLQHKFVLADNFATFFQWLVDNLENDNFHISQDINLQTEFNMRNPASKNFLKTLRHL